MSAAVMIVGLFLHILAAVIWVGGMFFAHQMLRPAAGKLDPAQRLPLLAPRLPALLSLGLGLASRRCWSAATAW